MKTNGLIFQQNRKYSLVLFFLLYVGMFYGTPPAQSGPVISNLPRFIENKGQLYKTDGKKADEVLFYSSTQGGITVYITKTGLSFVSKKESTNGIKPKTKNSLSKDSFLDTNSVLLTRMDLELIGSDIDKNKVISKSGANIEYETYYCGEESFTDITSYESIIIQNVYPGIDWELFYNEQVGLKYNFIAHAGSNPSIIKFKVVGGSYKMEEDGGIEYQLADLKIKDAAPTSSQGLKNVPTHFIKNEVDAYSFNIGTYDVTQDLIIDPTLTWATSYFGTVTKNSQITSGIIDNAGNTIWLMWTNSTTFPVMLGSAWYQSTKSGDQDLFLVKFNSSGVRQWATFFGATGAFADLQLSTLHYDKFNNKFCITATLANLPSTPVGFSLPIQSFGAGWLQNLNAGSVAYNGGSSRTQMGFISEFNNTSGALLWSTYLCGTGGDRSEVSAATYDSNGNLYVGGVVFGSRDNAISLPNNDFPVQSLAGAYNQTTFPTGGIDNNPAFLAKFDSGRQLVWSTFLGGQNSLCQVADLYWDTFSSSIYLSGSLTSEYNTIGTLPLTNPGGAFYKTGVNRDVFNAVSESFIGQLYPSCNFNWLSLMVGLNSTTGSVKPHRVTAVSQVLGDGLGNVYFGGTAWGVNATVLPLVNLAGSYFKSTCANTNPNMTDLIVGKFNAAHQLVWSTLYGDPSYGDVFTSMCLDKFGLVIGGAMVGYSGASLPSPTATDIPFNSGGLFNQVTPFSPVPTANGFVAKFCLSSLSRSWGSFLPYSYISAGTLLSDNVNRYLYVGTSGHNSPLVNPGAGAYQQYNSAGGIQSQIWRFKGMTSNISSIVNNTNCSPCNGSATVLANDAANPKYDWFTAVPTQTTQTASGLCANTYSVKVYDNQCWIDTLSLVISNSPATIPTITSALASGSINCAPTTVTLTAASGTNTLVWNGGPLINATNPATVSVPGNYTVTSTGANGCTSTSVVAVSGSTAVPVITSALASGNINCTPTTVTLTASSGTNTLVWNGGSLTNAANPATVSVAGNYTVTATAANGCSTTSVVTVTQNTTTPNISIANPSTLTCSNNTVTLTGSSTTSGVTYSWSPQNVTTNTATANVSGNYSLTVTNPSNGCKTTSVVSVSQNTTTPTITSATSSGNINCTPTTVTLTASSGTNTLQWNGGSLTNATNPATVSVAGNYTVTATSANGCSTTSVVAVSGSTAVPVITSALSSNNLSCSNTTATLTAASGTNTMLWNGGSLTNAANPATVSVAGNYTVIATGANGCSTTSVVSVTQNTTTPNISIANPSTLTCTNNAVTLTGSSSTSGVTYSWSPQNVTTNTATAIAAGNYSLTVTNPANGCSTTSVVTVTQNTTTPIITSAIASGSIGCTVTTATLTASSGTNTLVWNGGSLINAANPATVSASSNYTVTATGANGCTTTSVVSVTQNTVTPNISIANPSTLTCTNNTVTLTGSSTTSGVTYSWSPQNVTTNIATANAAGNYSLTVTNPANGCSTTSVVSVTQNTTAPAPTATNNATLTCSTTTVQLNGTPSSGVSYAWSGAGFNGPTNNQNAIANTAGVFTLTVTDNINGCIGTATTNVTQNSTVPTLTVTNAGLIICGIGTATLSATTTHTNASIVWNGGSLTSAANPATVSVSGVFIATITDLNNGCTSSTSATVSVNNPNITAGSGSILTCVTNTAQVQVTSTTTDITYNWSGAGITGSTNTNSTTVNAAGQYTCVITNSLSLCTNTAIVTVTQNTTQPTVTATNNATLTCTTTTVSLFGTPNAGVTYTWSPNVIGATNNQNATANAVGVYTLSVTDNVNGCTNTATTSVAQNTTQPTVTATNNATLTCTTTTATLFGTPNAGVTYTWSPNVMGAINNQNATANASGVYTLSVTDNANGCTNTATTSVAQNTTTPTVTATNNSTLTCTTTTATLFGTPNAGVTYTWSPNVIGAINNQNATANATGVYTLSVTDNANGCTNTATTSVAQNTTTPNVSATVSNTLTCLQLTTTLTGSSTTSGVTYSWSPQNVTTNTTTANATGNYSLTITNPTNGCATTSAVVVTSNTTSPTIASATVSNTLTCTNATATLTATSGTNTIVWNGGSLPVNNPNPSVVNQSGNYVVTVTDVSNGCMSSTIVAVTQNTTMPVISSITNTSLTCVNITATLSASSGTNTLIWNGGLITNLPNPATTNQTGIYTVTATDVNNGCTNTATTAVTQNTIQPTVTATNNVTLTCTTTTLTLFGTPNAGVTYTWSPNVIGTTNSQNATANVVGIYTLSVTDNSNGCTNTATTSVTQNTTTPNAFATISNTLTCSQLITTLTGSSTTPGVTYSWSPQNVTTNTTSATNAGNYSLTITNPSNGCSTNTFVTVYQTINTITANATSTDAGCTTAIGSIMVNAPTGGSIPYQYSINGSPNQTTPNFTSLNAGSYTISITDAIGCTTSFTQVVSTTPSPTLTAGNNATIQQGESTAIWANSTIGNTYQWFPSTGLNCVTCSSVTAAPEVSTIYTITVTDVNGCSASDIISITVKISCFEGEQDVFVANAFTPDGDGMDDVIHVIGKGIINIDWKIFNRWGELVYTTSDANASWNGKQNNKDLNAGVFVYFLKAYCANGNTITKKGNITIIK